MFGDKSVFTLIWKIVIQICIVIGKIREIMMSMIWKDDDSDESMKKDDGESDCLMSMIRNYLARR